MRTLLIITLAIFAFCLSACSGPVGNKVSIDQSYEGKQVELIAGDSLNLLVFTKPPGYGWKIVSISDKKVLKYESNELIPPEELQEEIICTCGRPEKEIWIFKALRSGTANIYMEYNKVEKSYSKAIKTFEVNVIVY